MYLPRDFNIDRLAASQPERIHVETWHLSPAGVRSALLKIAMSAIAWFIAAAWLNLEGTKVGFNLVIVTGIFVMALTLLLVCVSMTINERR
jgi:hypothetical protein